VMIFGPVESGEVSQSAVSDHDEVGVGCGTGAPGPSSGRTDTVSLAGLCSIRPWG
jgi:hypothetical protein